MDDTYSLAPIWFTDIVGSALVIVFSFLSVWYAARLKRTDPSNVVWTYLLWLCCALAGFGVSRGVGHIAMRVLLLLDMKDVWLALQPYSGAFNTLWFAVVASITLFFQRVQKIHSELSKANRLLEEKIRTIDALYEHILQSREAKLILEHTATVAHELRQPLAIIGGFARRLAKTDVCRIKDDGGEWQDSLKILVREVERLETILGELIDYVKPKAVKPEKTNPNNIIDYVLRINSETIRAKNLRIELDLCDDVVEIPLDPRRFEQVLRNLIANAVDASPVDGVLTVSTSLSKPGDLAKARVMDRLSSETYFQLKVQNIGMPIPPDEIERIFDPFFTTKGKGIGLGLTLSKKLVESHGGSLSVQSDEARTLFTVWLPVPQPPS